MIGLVVVPHSVKMTEGITEVAAQIGDGNARVIPVGGDEDSIETSPDRIREGIEEADDGGGVAVLVDLDNAVISTELTIEAAMDSGAVITDASALEGMLNAAVETTSKKVTLDLVVECAEDARGYRKLN